LIVATRGEVEHRDRINTDSNTSRERFIKKLAAKLSIDRDKLTPLIESQITKLAHEIDERSPVAGAQSKDDEQSQATLAAKMAAEWELWHTPAGDGYATFTHKDHKENWAVRSQTFKRFLAKRFFDQCGNAINSDALSAAINLLEAQALFEGEEHPMHVRVAEHESAIYVDLCNDRWQAVQITAEGWQVVDEAPVRFRRSRGMLPLPIPERGGRIELLREFLNVIDDTWPLVVSWLVATMRPRGPYPVLALFAEQGSGKSTAGRLLRDLIDPNSAPLRAEPKDARDLMIAANNSWCLCYDNLSNIPPWLSDALCRLSTGGGFATRELYTDQDEIIFDSQRPVLLTSIEEVATRSDLLDRCLIVLLSAIPEDKRRAEAELLAAFQTARPKILGALLDAVVVALQRLPSIRLPGLPRMADFALWAAAAETGFGWSDGTFMVAYHRNRESANEVALEAAIIAQPLLELLDEKGQWSGKSSELLTALETRVTDQIKREKHWPKNARSLSGHLKRLSPNLRTMGWILEKDRTTKKRLWIITRVEGSNEFASSPSPEPSSESSSEGECNSMQAEVDSFGADHYDPNDANDANGGDGWNGDRY
jgi:hypothetical protein